MFWRRRKNDETLTSATNSYDGDHWNSIKTPSEPEEDIPDFGYCYKEAFSNGTLLFSINDEDFEDCGYILCTASGKITVLFDERYEYESEDILYLEKCVKAFYDALQ